MAKEGKTVLSAQMVKKGEIMMRAKRVSAIRMYVNEFIVKKCIGTDKNVKNAFR